MGSLLLLYTLSLNKCIVTCVHHYRITECFHCPKNNTLCFAVHLFIPLPSPKPLSVTDIFNCLSSFDFSRMSYNWNHTVCSLLKLAFSHIIIGHVRFLHIFSWFDSSFIINLFPLSVCTTVYLYVHLPKDSLVVSRF